MRLDKQRIVVTGAFGTLGAAVVQAALGAGAQVAAIDRVSVPANLAAVHGFGGVDLADAGEAKRAIDAAAEALG
ncbi:MAG: NAD-dependent epimerase/dehydratase family protein, partial [Xanthomonadaceae bacterium]|nr:NAD-dependent epimerase/dehydratase family protein [Xanthomonadaceae bacterium]